MIREAWLSANWVDLAARQAANPGVLLCIDCSLVVYATPEARLTLPTPSAAGSASLLDCCTTMAELSAFKHKPA